MANNLSSRSMEGSTSTLEKVLYSNQLANTSATAVVTAAAGSSVVIWNAAACNVSGSAATLTISVVPSGGSAGATNQILKTVSIDAAATLTLSNLKDLRLGPGDSIVATAGTGAAINLMISGTIYS